MPKHRHKATIPASRPVPPRELGLRAFRQGDYTQAIKQWSTPDLERDSAVRTALTEAYFRRALANRNHPSNAASDLRRAADLLPGEARCWYHLGLMLHRANHLADARTAYARAADLGLQRLGFGFVRGLAELEHDPHLALDTLPWLAPEDRAALTPIAALLRGEPQAALTTAPGNWLERLAAWGRPDLTAALWRGLAFLASGDAAQALATLTLPKGQQLRAGAEQVRVLYHGLAAVTTGNPHAALTEWTEAARSAAKANVPFLPRVSQAIAQLHAQRLYELSTAGRWADSLKQALATLAVTPGEPLLLRISLVAANRLAQAAIQAGGWATALTHWQMMRGILESHPDLGPLPPILHNLAIAHEALEQWEPAATVWAALLGTLPKRASKKQTVNSEGLPLDEQRAWLRRRVLDNYKRAGRPDQAITYYKQAVKAAPDHLDLRLELASALLANQQTTAGRNELRRIIDKDPAHLGAHLLMAEMHQARGEWHAAEQSLRHVLEIDPGHETARRGLAQMMISRGVNEYNTGRYSQARRIYSEALTFSPTDFHLLVLLADTELALKDAAAARPHLEAALGTGKTEAYKDVFDCWAKHRNEAEARQVLARAETAGVASSHFYIDAAAACLAHSTPASPLVSLFGPPPKPRRDTTPSTWEQWGRTLIQQALASALNRVEALTHIVFTVGPAHPTIALEYARQLVSLTPEDPAVLTSLGLLQATTHDIAAAKDTLRKAERLARKQGQQDLVNHIAALRQQISSPFFGLLGSLLSQLGPEFEDEEVFFK